MAEKKWYVALFLAGLGSGILGVWGVSKLLAKGSELIVYEGTPGSEMFERQVMRVTDRPL